MVHDQKTNKPRNKGVAPEGGSRFLVAPCCVCLRNLLAVCNFTVWGKGLMSQICPVWPRLATLVQSISYLRTYRMGILALHTGSFLTGSPLGCLIVESCTYVLLDLKIFYFRRILASKLCFSFLSITCVLRGFSLSYSNGAPLLISCV